MLSNSSSIDKIKLRKTLASKETDGNQITDYKQIRNILTHLLNILHKNLHYIKTHIIFAS